MTYQVSVWFINDSPPSFEGACPKYLIYPSTWPSSRRLAGVHLAVEWDVPIARLNRDVLRVLSDGRLEEARVLLQNKLWTGAYYMTGLAVECALKSCLAAEVKQHDFPDRNFVNSMYIHNLEKLFRLNGALWVALETDIASDKKLAVNWSTVKDWDDEKRYDVVAELDATAMYEATTETRSGIIDWVRGKW